MKRWNLFLPEELIEEIKELAKRKDVPAADVVRTACEKYLAAVKRAEEAKSAPQATPAVVHSVPHTLGQTQNRIIRR